MRGRGRHRSGDLAPYRRRVPHRRGCRGLFGRGGSGFDRDGRENTDGGGMSINGKAFIVGAYEHPDRIIPDRSVAQIHAENTAGVLADAGLKLSDIDGFFCTGGAGMVGVAMADYLGWNHISYLDSTAVGGSPPVYQDGHDAAAIPVGKCQ